jgi:hypothetical protein
MRKTNATNKFENTAGIMAKHKESLVAPDKASNLQHATKHTKNGENTTNHHHHHHHHHHYHTTTTTTTTPKLRIG